MSVTGNRIEHLLMQESGAMRRVAMVFPTYKKCYDAMRQSQRLQPTYKWYVLPLDLDWHSTSNDVMPEPEEYLSC